MRKGQGATEYLTILAIVLIITLILVLILTNVPKIGQESKKRTSQIYWQNTNLALVSYAMSKSNDDVVIVRNGFGNDIKVTELKINNVDLTTSGTPGSDFLLAPGGSKTLVANIAGSTECPSAGDPYSLEVSGKFTDLATNREFKINPEGTKLEGFCSE